MTKPYQKETQVRELRFLFIGGMMVLLNEEMLLLCILIMKFE